MNFDVIIVGGGIAGLSCAVGLAEKNLHIAVIEAKKIPIFDSKFDIPDRVSAINTSSEILLERLGAWNYLDSNRVSLYTNMNVWDHNSSARLSFSSTEISESNLGYIIENNNIISALKSKVDDLDIAVFESAIISSINNDDIGVVVNLKNGTKMSARLLVGADGANSYVRKHFPFVENTKPYGHDAIIATMETQIEHNNTAFQCFMNTGVMAFLPLYRENQVSIVLSQQSDISAKTMKLSSIEFNDVVTNLSQNILGKTILLSLRKSFPLLQRNVDSYFKKRIVLVGDAAHTIHPLAGQGVNLALADVKSLIDIVGNANSKNRDYGHESTLYAYECERRMKNEVMIKSMQLIKNSFCHNNAALSSMVSSGVNLIDSNSLLKKFFIKQAMG